MEFSHFLIRSVCMDDVSNYFDFMEDNRKIFSDFVAGTVAATRNIEDTKTHLSKIIGMIENRQHYHFVITDKLTQKIIGVVLIKDVNWDIPKGEVGYFTDAKYGRKGITTKAVSEVVKYCFQVLKMNKLFLRTHKDNIPSRKVAEHNGFELEGIIRKDYKKTDGTLIDAMYYGLVRK